MLTGQYQRSLDSKIRVTLPATQRKELGDSVVLIRRENALHGYSPVASIPMEGKDRRQVDRALRSLNARATPVDIDSAGRVALGKIDESDPNARKELSLKRDVTIVGNGDHIEIWDTKKWDDYFNADSGVKHLRISSLACNPRREERGAVQLDS